jgi:hypothetical protein
VTGRRACQGGRRRGRGAHPTSPRTVGRKKEAPPRAAAPPGSRSRCQSQRERSGCRPCIICASRSRGAVTGRGHEAWSRGSRGGARLQLSRAATKLPPRRRQRVHRPALRRPTPPPRSAHARRARACRGKCRSRLGRQGSGPASGGRGPGPPLRSEPLHGRLKKASWKLTKTINENMWLGVDLLAQDRHLCLQLLHAVALARRRRCLPAPRAPRRGRAALAVARAFPAAAAHGARAAGCVSGSGAGGEARPRLWRGRRRTRASARGGFESKRRGPPRDGSGPPRDGSRRGARGAGAASRAPRKEPPALPSKARGGVGCYARYRADATADTRLRSGGARTRRGGVCARRRVEAGAGAVGTSTICAPKEAQIVEGGRQRGFVSERIFLRSWGWGRAPRQAESARRRATALLRPGPSPSARAAAPPWCAAASAAHGSNTCARRTKQRAQSLSPGRAPP